MFKKSLLFLSIVSIVFNGISEDCDPPDAFTHATTETMCNLDHPFNNICEVAAVKKYLSNHLYCFVTDDNGNMYYKKQRAFGTNGWESCWTWMHKWLLLGSNAFPRVAAGLSNDNTMYVVQIDFTFQVKYRKQNGTGWYDWKATNSYMHDPYCDLIVDRQYDNRLVIFAKGMDGNLFSITHNSGENWTTKAVGNTNIGTNLASIKRSDNKLMVIMSLGNRLYASEQVNLSGIPDWTNWTAISSATNVDQQADIATCLDYNNDVQVFFITTEPAIYLTKRNSSGQWQATPLPLVTCGSPHLKMAAVRHPVSKRTTLAYFDNETHVTPNVSHVFQVWENSSGVWQTPTPNTIEKFFIGVNQKPAPSYIWAAFMRNVDINHCNPLISVTYNLASGAKQAGFLAIRRGGPYTPYCDRSDPDCDNIRWEGSCIYQAWPSSYVQGKFGGFEIIDTSAYRPPDRVENPE